MYWNLIICSFCFSVIKLNNNIRCIETNPARNHLLPRHQLNNNIICIETIIFDFFSTKSMWLNNNIRCIETTWDFGGQRGNWVKQQHKMYWNNVFHYLITTILQVKQQHKMYWNCTMLLATFSPCLLNNNIRCIETELIAPLKLLYSC